MSKKNLFTLMAMSLAAVAGKSAYYNDYREPRKNKRPAPLPNSVRQQTRALTDLHEYNINGTIIKARNKKTAKRIYNKRQNICRTTPHAAPTAQEATTTKALTDGIACVL